MAKNKVKSAKKKSSFGKLILWVVAILVVYALTSAAVSEKTVEVQKEIQQVYNVQEPYVVEKNVTTTQYETQKVPYGVPRCEHPERTQSRCLSSVCPYEIEYKNRKRD